MSLSGDSDLSWEVILVGERCAKNPYVRKTAKSLPCKVTESLNGLEFLPPNRNDLRQTVFVYDEFTSGDNVFSQLQDAGVKLIGPPQLAVFAAEDVIPTRPQYCQSMKDATVCLSGFTTKAEKTEVAELIRFMGGSIRREVGASVTHIIAAAARCSKYQAAVVLERPVVLASWVKALWERRDDIQVTSLDLELMARHKVLPFTSCYVAFVGFCADEVKEMEGYTRDNGGIVASLEDDTCPCTHVVLEKKTNDTPAAVLQSKALIVKPEWFWGSIQMNARADEAIYAYEELAEAPRSFTRKRQVKKSYGTKLKRKVLQENLAKLAEEGMSNMSVASGDDLEVMTPGGLSTPRWSQSSIAPGSRSYMLSESSLMVSGLDLDESSAHITPNKRLSTDNTLDEASLPKKSKSESSTGKSSGDGDPQEGPAVHPPSAVSSTVSSTVAPAAPVTKATSQSTKAQAAKASPRHQVVMELCNTERNYCTILKTILSCRKGAEGEADQGTSSLLSHTHSKLIFGEVPAILAVHEEMLGDLERCLNSWQDSNAIGPIIISRAHVLESCYPKFVNFYEQIKVTIKECEKANPRFRAYLKVCERKPESGRQTLAELLINIVQRIPRIELLLHEVLKYTAQSCDDHMLIQQAKQALKGVMTHINEDKRKTEGQVVLFEIVNDIEGCPATVLSATRSFITKVDVECRDHHNERATIFVFSDAVEIAKWKSRHYATLKNSSKTTTTGKPSYKHMEFIPFHFIRRVVEIEDLEGDTDEFNLVFALVCQIVADAQPKLLTFSFINEQLKSKGDFLNELVKLIGAACCRTDFENILATCSPSVLGLEQPSVSMLSMKPFQQAVKKVKRVGSRASTRMKGTPNSMKRAVSGMLLTPKRKERSSLSGRKSMVVSPTPSTVTLDPSMMGPCRPSLSLSGRGGGDSEPSGLGASGLGASGLGVSGLGVSALSGRPSTSSLFISHSVIEECDGAANNGPLESPSSEFTVPHPPPRSGRSILHSLGRHRRGRAADGADSHTPRMLRGLRSESHLGTNNDSSPNLQAREQH